MRQLTSRQKKLLDKWIEEDKPYITIESADGLEESQWRQLEAINDTEILYQEVNRYISDIRMKQIYK